MLPALNEDYLSFPTFQAYAQRGGEIGLYTAVQLWNPVDSGVLCEVMEVKRFLSGGAGVMHFSFESAEDNSSPSYRTAIPLRRSSDESKALVSSIATEAYGSRFYSVNTASIYSSKFMPDMLKDRIVVPPGFNFKIARGSTNLALYASIRWVEKPI